MTSADLVQPTSASAELVWFGKTLTQPQQPRANIVPYCSCGGLWVFAGLPRRLRE